MEQVRLNKFIAQCGACSRREADKLIEQGLVCIDGRVAGMGEQVTAENQVTLRGKLLNNKNVTGPQKTYVYAYYKPVGIVCTEKDKHAEKMVTDYVKTPVRVTYAGRLDKDSEGLLLLTNDGNLINDMMRGANGHEKEYLVKVNKKITSDILIKMSRGVFLKDLGVTTRECRVEAIGPYTFRIILTQGLNRQIRRMCQAFGYEVKSLKRVRIMNILLGDLKPGEYRLLDDYELEMLRQKLQK